MEIKNVVCYSFSLNSRSALAHLRLTAPLGHANINIINGIENGEIMFDRVRDGDIVVIQRDFPREFIGYEKIINIARTEQKPVIFEFDDLLFCLPDNHPDRQNPAHGTSLLPMLQLLMEANLVTVSTPKLREFALNYNDNVVVLPNYFDDTVWQLKPPALKNQEDGPLTIGYMGGSSHKSDVEYLVPVFLELLNRYPQKIQFQFWGVHPPSTLASFAQVKWSLASVNDYIEFAAFFQDQTADIFVAPLVDNPFNQAKSPIKFFEYSALGVPGVFSRFETYTDTITHGYDGLLALSLDEWTCCLSQLIEDGELRYRLASNAQKTIRENWLLTKNAYQWKDAYQIALAHPYSRRDLKNNPLKTIEIINQQLNEAHANLVSTLEKELSEILTSETWKIALFLRNLRIKLFPLGSRREKLVRWGANSFTRMAKVVGFLGNLPLKIGRKLTPIATPTFIALLRRIKYRFFNLLRRIKYRFFKWNIFSKYRRWIRKNELGREQLVEQRAKIDVFEYKPLISLIVPVWNTPPKILNKTIGSVVDQTYDNWELCIADGHSSIETQKVLSDWTKKDSRINIKFLNENKGIAVNSNEALSLAQGEFVGFLDHDDLLAPFALFEVVNRLQSDTNVDLIYSDEDKINENGQRFDPFFKPDFSPDYLRSVNYMAHFLVIRKSLGDAIGWFREGYDGAQDYDLVLRLVEKARTIGHIPKILYHWRVWANSTAGSAEAKPYANNSGKRALQEHLNRIGLSAHVDDGYSPTFYRTHYQYSGIPLVSIIIPSQDHAADLEYCINFILQRTTYSNFEIFIVENGSKEQGTFNLYKRLLEKDNRVHLVQWDMNEPFNYSRINNWAARQANGEVLLFLNNDTQVINEDWLEEMLQFAMRPDVGAVGAKLYYPDESIQHAGVIIAVGGIAGHGHKYFSRQATGYFGQLVLPHNVSAVTAACLMVRKQVFWEIDGFDETYALAFGDVDLCLSILKKGYLNIWTPYAELYHHESKTSGYEDTSEKFKRFEKETMYFKQKWDKVLAAR